MELLADLPELVDLAREAGHDADARLDRQTLAAADAVLLGADDAWDRVRGWRTGGLRVPVVVVTRTEPPSDRVRLEPVVLLREASATALDRCLQALEAGRPDGVVQLAAGKADLDRSLLRRADGEVIELSALETRLLGYLAARTGRIVEREELQTQVWDHRKAVPTRAVDMAVSRLRKKIETDPRTPACLLTVRNGGYRLLAGAAPVAAAPPAPSLVGRDASLATLASALIPGAVVALVGPPGVGKSSLARAWGATVRAVEVDLTGASDPEGAIGRLAAAVGAKPGEDGDLGHVLGRAEAWVIDGLDDWPVPAARLTHPNARILLVSTRAPAPGTRVIALAPLEPDDAISLLLRRVTEAGGMASADELGPLVDELDRLPLALELAAPAVVALGAEATRLALRSDDLLGLDGSLRAAWERLGEEGRTAWGALATFEGAFIVADARAVLGADPLRGWLELARHQLLAPAAQGHRLLGIVRAFARRQGADRPYLDAHRGHVARRARALVEGLTRTDGARAFTVLVAWRSDLEAALRRALEHGEAEHAVTLAAGLDRVLRNHGTSAERQTLWERVVPVASRATEPHARALFEQAGQWLNRDHARAVEVLERVRELAHAAGAAELESRARLVAADIERRTRGSRYALDLLASAAVPGAERATLHRIEAARHHVGDLLGTASIVDTVRAMEGIFEELLLDGEVWDAMVVGNDIAPRLRVTHFERATVHAERLLALARTLPDPRMLGQALITYAMSQWDAPGVARAEAALDEADALFAAVEPVRTLQVAHTRSLVLLQAGRADEARAGLERTLAWAMQRDYLAIQADARLYLASLELDVGNLPAGLEHAVGAVDVSRRLGDPHFEAHAQLDVALAELFAGRARPARETLQGIDPALFTATSRHAWATRSAVASRLLGEVDPAAEERCWSLAHEQPGRFGEALVEVIAAARSGDLATLDAWTSGRRVAPYVLEIRLAARAWKMTI
ncbi:MAG: winged helix-turn-helix domain-containing protein [Alphaproteobacteria bacterium]|nr:winged helix-turn-helix domain-containing protein [Alphaproteobacteria bacterium]